MVTEVAGRYADGAWYVDLVPVIDPVMVAPAIAAALGLGERQARSAARPTNEVSGEGRGRATAGGADSAGASVDAAAASARRSFTWSLRSSEDTWLSTVRTEMKSRAAISALVRCSPSAASTSASRADTPVPEAAEPALTLRFCPNPGPRGRPRVNAVSALGETALC